MDAEKVLQDRLKRLTLDELLQEKERLQLRREAKPHLPKIHSYQLDLIQRELDLRKDIAQDLNDNPFAQHRLNHTRQVRKELAKTTGKELCNACGRQVNTVEPDNNGTVDNVGRVWCDECVDKWLATFPAFNSTNTGFSFGQAIELLRAGKRVTRIGWRDHDRKWIERFDMAEHAVGEWHPFIAMKTKSGKLIPYLASPVDIFATDWKVA